MSYLTVHNDHKNNMPIPSLMMLTGCKNDQWGRTKNHTTTGFWDVTYFKLVACHCFRDNCCLQHFMTEKPTWKAPQNIGNEQHDCSTTYLNTGNELRDWSITSLKIGNELHDCSTISLRYEATWPQYHIPEVWSCITAVPHPWTLVMSYKPAVPHPWTLAMSYMTAVPHPWTLVMSYMTAVPHPWTLVISHMTAILHPWTLVMSYMTAVPHPWCMKLHECSNTSLRYEAAWLQ
jgi:hypothetical protein